MLKYVQAEKASLERKREKGKELLHRPSIRRKTKQLFVRKVQCAMQTLDNVLNLAGVFSAFLTKNPRSELRISQKNRQNIQYLQDLCQARTWKSLVLSQLYDCLCCLHLSHFTPSCRLGLVRTVVASCRIAAPSGSIAHPVL
jgi:hypothetical protein